jgi:phage terminase large subunit GpA-like protein
VWKPYFAILQRDWETDEGGKMRVMVSGVDTGYHTNFAYEFMKLNPFILGLKGQEDNKYTPFDSATAMFKEADVPGLYMLQVNRMKDQLSERIDLKWMDREGQQPAGFMNFPQPTDGKYTMEFFTHYAAERRDVKLNEDGTAVAARWVKKHSTAQNHFWDTDLYNRAVRDIFVDLFCKTEGVKKPSWHTFVSMIIPR